MLLALPPNQKGYLILGALCLFSFLSALFACDSAFAPGDSATSLMVTAVSQVSSFILLPSLFFSFPPFFSLMSEARRLEGGSRDGGLRAKRPAGELVGCFFLLFFLLRQSLELSKGRISKNSSSYRHFLGRGQQEKKGQGAVAMMAASATRIEKSWPAFGASRSILRRAEIDVVWQTSCLGH